MGLLSALQDNRFKFDVAMDGGSRPIDLSRNILVTQALRSKCDYLFFLDSDIVLEGDHIRKLSKIDRDIVSGLYRARAPPNMPVANLNGKKLDEDLLGQHLTMTVDEAGMGCCLIKTDVFKTIGKHLPWRCLTNHEAEGKMVCSWEYESASTGDYSCPHCGGMLVAPFFHHTHGFVDDNPGGEDYFFCELAKINNFEIFVRCDVVPAHENRVLITKDGVVSMMKGADKPL